MDAAQASNAPEEIDALIARLADWRGETLAAVRAAIRQADPAIVEEWKWRGSPTWSCGGMIAVANAHKAKVKLTFAQGAHLEDPDGLFNAGLDGNMWRAIDLFEGDAIDGPALSRLVRTAVAFNHAKKTKPKTRAKP